jgi:uncharacterized protein YbjT (DUF2867 family)
MASMRVLIVGGSGFVGSALTARLAAAGYETVTVARGSEPLGSTKHFRIDIARATTPEAWFPALDGVQAVVNCAGVLHDGAGRSTHGVHVRGIGGLYAACEQLEIRRIVHFSAIGVDREAPTEFSRSKRQGDEELMARDLDWVVLRPSVIIGHPAYGGSALLRGLAALPVIPVMRDAGPLQLVHLNDVIETALHFLHPTVPARKVIELVSPRRWEFNEAIRLFRRWLRWPRAPAFNLPRWAARTLYRLGDFISALGWATPVNTTVETEMRRGAIGDPSAWRKATGIEPRDIEAELMREPASVQERWFARLYALKPLVFGVFALFWIVTGLISLGPGWEHGMGLLLEGGLGARPAALTVSAGALADIMIGLAILYRPLSRYGLYAALAISVVYVIIGSILVPRLWSDPLGPMLKIWPIIVLNLVAIAIREGR